MPLQIMLPMVVIGIAGIAVLLHLLGLSRQADISKDNAAQLWHRHYPDDAVGDIVVAQDGHAALVQTQEGPGLLWSFGADTTARHLHAVDVQDTDQGLRLDLHDFAAPSVSIPLSDTERQIWRNLIEAA